MTLETQYENYLKGGGMVTIKGLSFEEWKLEFGKVLSSIRLPGKTFLLIEGDTNDMDIIGNTTEVVEEDILKIKEIIRKLLPYRSKVRWDKGIEYSTGEMREGNTCGAYYIKEGVLTKEEVTFLEKFLPYGDSNYSGIHTITNIVLYEQINKLL